MQVLQLESHHAVEFCFNPYLDSLKSNFPRCSSLNLLTFYYFRIRPSLNSILVLIAFWATKRYDYSYYQEHQWIFSCCHSHIQMHNFLCQNQQPLDQGLYWPVMFYLLVILYQNLINQPFGLYNYLAISQYFCLHYLLSSFERLCYQHLYLP